MDEALTEQIRQAMPLCATLGVQAVRSDREAVVLALGWRADLCTSGGVLHGGALMALADAAGGALAFANLPQGAVGTTTTASQTQLLRAVTGGTVQATARVLHAGSTTIVVETEVRDGDRLVSKTTQTQLVLRPRA